MCLSACVFVCLWACLYVFVEVCACVYVRARVLACVHVWLCLYLWECTHLCVPCMRVVGVLREALADGRSLFFRVTVGPDSWAWLLVKGVF